MHELTNRGLQMTAFHWVALGIACWALLLFVVVTLIKRDRRKKTEALASLGLSILTTDVVNPRKLRAPRPIARGTYEGLPVVVEDYPLVSDGSKMVITRIRTTDSNVSSSLPTFVIASHSFAERTCAPGFRIVDGVLPTHEVLADDEEAERFLLDRKEVFAKQVGALTDLRELSVSGGGCVVLIAGAPHGPEVVQPVLDLFASLITAKA